MSVFHRVDELDALPAAVFLPRMVRLPLYDGAVRHTLRREAEQPAPTPARAHGAVRPQEQATPVEAHSLDQLAGLNRTKEYGPMGVNQAGVFDLG